MALHALIPAAGVGARVAAGTQGAPAKQYLALAGHCMLWHAIRCLSHPAIETVFVVLSPEDVVFSQYDWRAFAGRLEPLYCGGATRRDSVYNGLVAAMAGIQTDDWILVHDAARPCLPAQSLQTLIDTCLQDPVGGLLALPCADTVKRIAPENAQGVRSLHTESRASLWLAQTPQMFRAGLLAQALRLANAEVTDEASAIEQMGLQPRLVQGSRRNLKVTYPEDVAMANALLENQ